MDINIVREAILLLGLGAFVGIVCWAYGSGRKSRFEHAAATVFEDEALDAVSVAQTLARARRTDEGR